MRFYLELNQEKAYGQMPVLGIDGHMQYLIKGNLENPNHTLYLSDFNNQEVGRLYRESINFIASFTIDVINHSLVRVKKVNSPLTNIFYVTRLNYFITGSIKKGSYNFRAGFKTVASVRTIMGDSGVVLLCTIKRPEDVPFILLIAVLFTQWHVKPLRLPSLSPLPRRFSTNPTN